MNEDEEISLVEKMTNDVNDMKYRLIMWFAKRKANKMLKHKRKMEDKKRYG